MEIQIPMEFPKNIRETLETDIKETVANRISTFRRILGKQEK